MKDQWGSTDRTVFVTPEEMLRKKPYIGVLAKRVASLPDDAVIVELGTHYGSAMGHMVRRKKPSQRLYAVDHFRGAAGEEEFYAAYQTSPASGGLGFEDGFWQAMGPYKDDVTLIKKDFREAVKDFDNGSIDMIFIDGDHLTTYRELTQWWPKLKPSAVVYVHDVNQDRWTVKKDLDLFCHERGLEYSMSTHDMACIMLGSLVWKTFFESLDRVAQNHPYLKDLAQAVRNLPRGANVAELGCWMGKATVYMLNASPDFKIHVVDHFRGTSNEGNTFRKDAEYVKTKLGIDTVRGLFEQGVANIANGKDRVVINECEFSEAVARYGDGFFDMVFFDGDHLATYRELVQWWPKLKDGGVAYCHDINQPKYTVLEDCKRFCRENGLQLKIVGNDLGVIRKPYVVKNDKPRAYIITMAYNARKYIRACVESVDDQDYPYITHVVVDDGSTDGTWERLQDFRTDYRKLVRNEKNLGSPVGSFMRGIEEVLPNDRDVIFWLDGDDWLIDESAVSKMMRAYERDHLCEMAYSQHYIWKGGLKEPDVGYSKPRRDRTQWRLHTIAYSHFRSFKYHMLQYHRPEDLRHEDGRYLQYCGDSALFLPMLEVAKKVIFVDEPLYCYNEATPLSEGKKSMESVFWYSGKVRDLEPNTNNRSEVFPEARFAPTRRFKLDHGRACNIECKACYYLHQKPWKNRSGEEIVHQIIAGAKRGNSLCDISGGEPTIAKRLPDWIRMCMKYGVFPGIITHGQDVEDKLETLWDAGLQDILFSIHGDRKDHNEYTQSEKRDGYGRLFGAMEKCAGNGFKFRTNTVLTNYFESLPRMADELGKVNPYVSNFINFNPYYEWAKKERLNQAPLSWIAPALKQAIDILTSRGTMVNVRYVPFCFLKNYEKHVVGMYQVMFDPYEWDYGVPKTVEAFNKHGEVLAKRTNRFAPKCGGCAIAGTVCSGVNAVYLDTFGEGELDPYGGDRINDKFHFRRNADPRQLHTHRGHNYFWWLKRYSFGKKKEVLPGRGVSDNNDWDSTQLRRSADGVCV
jgi:glycosyltransferase involved in cell wall biosynthesis/predicted O-methyltransferase YrrM